MEEEKVVVVVMVVKVVKRDEEEGSDRWSWQKRRMQNGSYAEHESLSRLMTWRPSTLSRSCW